MTGKYLQFAPGKNNLPEPWQNLDVDHDLRKPLRFEGESVRFILAEHVIEHVSFHQGIGWLLECMRVLEPGGVLRVSFPDVVRISHRPVEYADALAAHLKEEKIARPDLPEPPLLSPRGVTLLQFSHWGHQMAWTEGLMYLALLAVGFRRVTPLEYGESEYPELRGIDGHHLMVGKRMAVLETSTFEATK